MTTATIEGCVGRWFPEGGEYDLEKIVPPESGIIKAYSYYLDTPTHGRVRLRLGFSADGSVAVIRVLALANGKGAGRVITTTRGKGTLEEHEAAPWPGTT